MNPIFPILMAGALTAAAAAQAQPREGRMPEHRQAQARSHERMMDRLNLTADQEVKLRKLRVDHQKNQIQLQAKIRTARLDMQELWAGDKPDRNAIEKKMREIHDMEYQAKVSRLDHHLSVMGALNPEQQKLMKESRRGRGMHGWKPGMRHEGRRNPGMMRPGMGQGWGSIEDFDSRHPDLTDFGFPLRELEEDLPAPPAPTEN